MSDSLPIMSGSFQAQDTSAAANAQGKTAGRNGDSQFPALFQSVMQDEAATPADSDTLLQPALLPVDLSVLNTAATDDPANTDTADPNALMSGITAMPFFAADPGNGLPQTNWSGYVAVADDDGAAAMALQGDQDNVVSSKPTFARDLPNAILKAQEQVVNAQLQQAATPVSDATDFAATLNKEGMPAARLERQMLLDTAPSQQQAGTPAVTHAHTAMVNDLSSLTAGTARGGDTTAQQINLPVQHPQWAQQVGDRVQWLVGQNLQQADIRLNPPELGALEVRIQVQGDQANVNFSSPHAVVRDALDAAMPRLREMLQAHGLTLGDVNVSGQALAQHQSRDSGANGSGQQSRTHRDAQSGEIAGIDAIPAAQRLHTNGMLDVYA